MADADALLLRQQFCDVARGLEDPAYPEVDWGEDQIWAWEALKLGFEKVYVDNAAVFHSHDFDFKQQYEVSRTEGRFWAEHFGITLVSDIDGSLAAVNAHDEGFGRRLASIRKRSKGGLKPIGRP